MATQKQIEANRLNALKSTGPRTAEGKAATRLNALQHGIFAEAPTVIGEDTAAFEALRDSYLARWEPATPEEETLVSSLVTHALFLARFPKVEAHLWNIRIDGRPDPHNPYYYAIPYALIFKHLTHLQHRIDSTERHFRCDLALLIKLQAARKEAAPIPEPISQPDSPEPVAAETGFVH